MFDLKVPASQFDMADNHLAPGMMYAKNKFPLESRLNNTHSALQRNLPAAQLSFKVSPSNEAIIIGAGPSIDSQLDNLRDIAAPIFCIDRMCSWLDKQNIIADYVVALDASEDVAGFVEQGPLTAQYLLATQCTEETFDTLKDRSCYLYSPVDIDLDLARLEKYWRRYGYPAPCFINAGPSVVHASIALALLLGYRRLHIFGFDCHVGAGLYAGNDEPSKDIIDVKVGERVWHTTMPFVMFAERFVSLIETAQRFNAIDSVNVYGDSLAGELFKKHIDWSSMNVGERTRPGERL